MSELTIEEQLRALQDVITNAYEWSGINRPSKVPFVPIAKVWNMLDEITDLRGKVPPPTIVEKGKNYAWRETGTKRPWTIGQCTAIVNTGVATFEWYDQLTKEVLYTVRSTSELEIIPAL